MKAILERDSGSPIVFDPEKLTGSEYLNRWLNASAKFSVGPNPFHRYAAVDKNDLAPAFGTVSSRDLALATVRYTLGVLSVAMNKA